MITRDRIAAALHQLNAAENSRPTSTVEETSDRIDKVMSPDVHGWRNGTFVADRATERAAERIGFGALTDYHRDFEHMIIEPPMACITWTIKGSYSGKEVRVPGSSVFEFGEDGLVRRYWMYVNPADFWYRAEYLATLQK
ncbi:nuclear transport factor 2 family protein [Phenylobacterium sp.]|uniref:nuclear transport factor 2 family protein n=1 Tax=Phenylobacterium sp. TaxID=1871053 RepID=UPI0025F8C3F1|nr:nuclear transport factor 2 family protein [Phenylobacterium sp.]MBX3482393.1 nuclear transport factor 2 family protein [Phenylobacterium sp.]MCW5758186.1 nuclear transport factor 2 family protein [Phenylobacterium sp.]